MSRCRSCNTILFKHEEDEDLCLRCIAKSYEEYSITCDKQYVLGELEEGMTPPTPVIE